MQDLCNFWQRGAVCRLFAQSGKLLCQAHLAAPVAADADSGHANSTRARVHQHLVMRLEAATDEQRVVGRHVGHRHGGSILESPVAGHVPHLREWAASELLLRCVRASAEH